MSFQRKYYLRKSAKLSHRNWHKQLHNQCFKATAIPHMFDDSVDLLVSYPVDKLCTGMSAGALCLWGSALVQSTYGE